MGVTVEQLGQSMTALEFGELLVLEHEEPLGRSWQLAIAHVLAALANGPLQRPQPNRNWSAVDFMPTAWQDDSPDEADESAEMTIAKILMQARLGGMVH